MLLKKKESVPLTFKRIKPRFKLKLYLSPIITVGERIVIDLRANKGILVRKIHNKLNNTQ